MEAQIKLGVYRRLDNRAEGLSDDSPRAIELHNRRKAALHDVLDEQDAPVVVDWGDTDDTQPHEFVEIIVAVAAKMALEYVIVPGLKSLAEKLAEKAVDEGTSQIVKWFVSKLRPKQEAHQILDFLIELPNGTRIHVDPPGENAAIRINFADGTLSSIDYERKLPLLAGGRATILPPNIMVAASPTCRAYPYHLLRFLVHRVRCWRNR
jgi:hypothetical protein